MTDQPLSQESQTELHQLVEQLVTASGQGSYQAHIKRKATQTRFMLRREPAKGGPKRGRGQDAADFAEEVMQYLEQAVRDLMADGVDQAEAVRTVKQRFDKAQAAPGFSGFEEAFDDFGLVPRYVRTAVGTGLSDGSKLEFIGLGCSGFLVLGLIAGPLTGWLIGRTWLATGIGLGAGVGAGVVLGLISKAIRAHRRTK